MPSGPEPTDPAAAGPAPFDPGPFDPAPFDPAPFDPAAPDGRAADWAASGVVPLTGHPDGPPLVPPGRAATVARRLAERIGAATAGRVRVDGARLLGERAAFTGHTRRGRVSVGGGCRLLPTADGWAAVSCVRPDDPALLGAMVGAELPDDPWPAIAAWLREHPGRDLAERATLLGVAATPVTPTAPPTSAAPPASAGQAVPARPATSTPAAGGTPTRQAAGLLVVDFSALWAGPLAAHLLGLGGARVVKVETRQRPDGARRGDPEFYRLLHAGHESVAVDPADPADRRALRRLVAAADVVIEASRPRALAGWGLDADAAAAAGTTWISITAAGRGADRVGFGDDIAAGAGLVALDHRGEPVFCGDAIADPLAGLTAAALALAEPPGRPWDLSMSAVVAATLDPDEPAAAARWDGDRLLVDTADGPVPVEPPVRRPVAGHAAASGADNAAVLAGLR